MKRTPDKETESFRLWRLDKNKDPSEYEELGKKGLNDFNIKFGKYEITFSGFGIVKNKEEKVIFAYKLKRQDKLCLYWFDEGKEGQEIKKKIFEFLKAHKLLGYEVRDVMEQLKEMETELELEEKIAKKENKK